MLYRRRLSVFAFLLLLSCYSSASARQGATAAPEPERRNEKMDPARVAVGSSGWVDVGLRVQLLSDTRWGALEDGAESTLHFRRIRPALQGQLLDGRLAFKLQLSTLPDAFELVDLWVAYRLHPWLCLQLGQQKIAYTRYRTRSDGKLPLVDWPLTTQYFGSERQIGVVLRSAPQRPRRFAYALNLSTGNNARTSHQVKLAEAYGEASLAGSSAAGMSRLRPLHPELSARLSTLFGHHGPLPPWRLQTELSAAYDFRPERALELAARSALELIFTVRHLELWVTGHLGLFEDGAGDLGLGLAGAVGELSYRLHRHLSLGARFSRVLLLERLRRDVADWQATRPAGSAPTATGVLVDHLGSVTAEQEVGLSVNVHFLGHNLKWQTELRWVRWDLAVDGALDDFQLRSQLQLMI